VSEEKKQVSPNTTNNNSNGQFQKPLQPTSEKPPTTENMATMRPITKETLTPKSVPDSSNSNQSVSLAAATKNPIQSQSSKPVIEGTAVAQVQVSDKLTTGGDVIASKSKSGKEKESSSTAFSSMYVRTSESAAPSAQGAKVIQSSTSSGVSQQNIADQIAESVYASMRRGDNNIVVRLNPPELGSVVVRFQQQSDQITGLLEVTRDQTRNEIEQALPQILRTLQDSGVQIKRLEVVLTDQQGLNANKEQLQQDGWSRQQQAQNNGWEQERQSISWMAGGNGYESSLDTRTKQVDGRINMLV
jgi:flagellar hook-length control protein FliK